MYSAWSNRSRCSIGRRGGMITRAVQNSMNSGGQVAILPSEYTFLTCQNLLDSLLLMRWDLRVQVVLACFYVLYKPRIILYFFRYLAIHIIINNRKLQSQNCLHFKSNTPRQFCIETEQPRRSRGPHLDRWYTLCPSLCIRAFLAGRPI
jgi:hypothetical protein